jgi:hypothetical protein
MSSRDHTIGHDRLTATWIELAIRLGVLGLLLYLAFILVRPFITIAIWSVVLTGRALSGIRPHGGLAWRAASIGRRPAHHHQPRDRDRDRPPGSRWAWSTVFNT